MSKLDAMRQEKKPQESSSEGLAWQAARAYGIDVSLLETNLQLSPHERIQAHARALDEALMLQQAVREQHGGS